MRKTLEIVCEGKESSFQVRKLDRSKLYGFQRRIPVDAQGRECSFAFLTRDGRYILPSGSTALLYLDPQGDVVERNQLQATGRNGEPVKSSSSDASLEIGETIEATELLDYTITHAYSLEPVFLSPSLETLLSRGIIFRLPLHLYNSASYQDVFLLGNEVGFFVLVGERSGFEYIGLTEADHSLPDSEDDPIDFDDPDFTMRM